MAHKHKRKKHKERFYDIIPDQEDVSVDAEFKTPLTRSAVTVVKKSTDPKVSLLAPDLESPVLPPCVQNFTESPPELSTTCSEQERVGDDEKMMHSTSPDKHVTSDATSVPAVTTKESLEDDGIEEGEILEVTSTHITGNVDPPLRDGKVVRKLKRKSIELSADEKLINQKLKKRKWKKEKDIGGEKTKKHKIR